MNSVSVIKVLQNTSDINSQSNFFRNNKTEVKEQNTNRNGVYKSRTIKIKLFAAEDEEMVMNLNVSSIPKTNIIQKEPTSLTTSPDQEELIVPDFMDDILSKM